jgi:hypothetical protein
MFNLRDQVKTVSEVKATDYITIPAGTIGEIYESPDSPKVRVLFTPRHTIGLQWVPVVQIVKI